MSEAEELFTSLKLPIVPRLPRTAVPAGAKTIGGAKAGHPESGLPVNARRRDSIQIFTKAAPQRGGQSVGS